MTDRRRGTVCAAIATAALVGDGGTARGARVGDVAPLFKTVDEQMRPVDMRELIRGKPLVLAVGSAS